MLRSVKTLLVANRGAIAICVVRAGRVLEVPVEAGQAVNVKGRLVVLA